MTHRVAWHLAATLLVATSAAAGWAETPLSITTTATGARALALAGIGAAAAATPDAAQLNPAALAFLDAGGMTLAHRVVAPGVAMQGGTIAIPWGGRATFALDAGVHRVDGSPAASATSTGRDATFAARGGVHAALRLPAAFAIGAGVARYSSTLEDARAHGWCTDAGLSWQYQGWRAGAALRGWSFANTAPGDERRWSAGAARAWRAFDIAMQVDGRRHGDVGGGGALTWRALRALELRAGVHHDPRDGDRFGTGLAVAAGAAQLEWGCRFASGARSENVVGLAVAFGGGSARAAAEAPAPRPERARAAKPVKARASAAAPAPTPAPPPAPPATPPAAQKPLPMPAPVEDAAPAAPRCYSVTAGTHPTLEAASTVIFKLRTVDLRATVERRGDRVLVVVQRCMSHADATALHARVTRAGIQASIEAE